MIGDVAKVEYDFWLGKGYAETTVGRHVRLLNVLARHADLRDPESVKVGLTGLG